MIVGPAGDDPVAPRAMAAASALELRMIWAEYSLNSGFRHSPKHTALAAIMCMRGPPWTPGNTAESIALACAALAQDEPAARSAQRLVRGGRDEVGVRDGRGVQARRHQTAMWAMSAKSSAPEARAISPMRAKSITRE